MSILDVCSTRESGKLEERVKEILAEEEVLLLREVRKYRHRLGSRVRDAIDPRRTQLERVTEALNAAKEPLTVREVAETTKLDPASVRMVLYSRQGTFGKDDSAGPRSTRWFILQPTGTSALTD